MIEFKPAKNQEMTASVNGILLHSAYNPSKEAERFVDNLHLTYESIIILIEPALAYTALYLRKKFPDKKIGAIRFSDEFKDYNSEFDFIFDYHNPYLSNLSDLLLHKIGEENLYSCRFIDWEASKKTFSLQYNSAIKEIENALQKAKTILVTREYFEKKWFLNSLNFLKYLKNPVHLNEKINKNILIITSGPSLRNVINIIKEHQNLFFIIVLSSALSICIKNNIRIDLCMTTDGGFWAGQHLKHITNDIPIAIPSEAYCPKAILNNNPILPMYYKDGLSKELFKLFPFEKSVEAERNGTVSGTALKYALKISDKDIFFAGLDMANAKGFQHTQPNELEINNSLNDYRINNKETRLCKSEFSEGSMKLYLNWFQNENFAGRTIYRIIDNAKNKLGQLIDISSADFFSKINLINKDFCSQNIQQSLEASKRDLSCLNFSTDAIIELVNKGGLKTLFPLSFMSLLHNPDNKEVEERLLNEKNKLINKIKDICDD